MEELESLVVLAASPNASFPERHEAFGELVVRFQDMAYGCAYAVVGDAALAQDVAQEAFIAAYQNLTQLRDPKAFPGWFRRIVLTQCNRLTRGAHLPTQPIETVPNLSSKQAEPSAMAESQELKEQIQAAIQALPESQRVATVLYYIDGYSQQEVAEFLEVPLDVVKKRLQRAREGLRERMMDMVRDDLQEQRPSRDDRFVQAVQLATAFKTAASDGQLALLDPLLVDGMDVNARGEDGQTLLHWAAQNGHLEMAEALIEQYRADPNVRDRFGRTPLQEAVERGHTAIADLLRRHGGEE